MKKLFILFIITSTSLLSWGQEFNVPKNYVLNKAEDYEPYEDDVLNCVKWLIKTPINKENDRRKEANTFFIKWISGCPYISIEINDKIVTFSGTSPELLIIFLAGWTKFAIESKIFDNKTEGSLAGIETTIDFYFRNKHLMSKDKNLEKYIKMKEKGELKAHVEKYS